MMRKYICSKLYRQNVRHYNDIMSLYYGKMRKQIKPEHLKIDRRKVSKLAIFIYQNFEKKNPE